MKKFIIVILLLTLLPGCQKGSSPDDTKDDTEGDTESDINVDADVFHVDVSLALETNPAAPGTVGIVTWSVQDVDVDSAEIHFGLDTDYGMVAPVDLN